MSKEINEEEDDSFMDWECPECKTCECIAYHTVHKKENDIPEKWICVGKIIRSKNPKNLHEAMNQIRFCIAELHSENESKQWEWTPYEAMSVSTVLSYGVRAILEEQQEKTHKRLKKKYPLE